MNNIQDFIVFSKMFRTFKVDDLLFAEFKCPVEESRDNIWCNNNFFAFILTGETLIKSARHEYPMLAGECVFAKKGSIIIESPYQEDFCEMLIFVPDEFIKSVILKYELKIDQQHTEPGDSIFPFGTDSVLQAYFYSLLSYFNQPKPPPASLLKLKFEELIIHILSSNKYNRLRSYFGEISKSNKPSIKQIMEDNYMFNLSLPEFARLCARSLSSFKTDFKQIFDATPGRWLQAKRLEHSRYLLESTNGTLDDIYLNSGFKNKSHFTREFKNKFGCTPGKYQSQVSSIKK